MLLAEFEVKLRPVRLEDLRIPALPTTTPVFVARGLSRSRRLVHKIELVEPEMGDLMQLIIGQTKVRVVEQPNRLPMVIIG